MRCTMVRMFGVGGLLVSLTACGLSHVKPSSAGPPSRKTVNATPIRGNVQAIDLASDQQGWMITDQSAHGYVESTTLYHTADWGKQWQVVARYAKHDAVIRGVAALAFSSPHLGTALAGLGVAMGHAQYQILRTNNGGRTWSPTATIWMPSGSVTLSMLSATQGVIVGGPGGGTREVAVMTKNGGRHWTPTPLPAPSPLQIGASLSATRLAFSSLRDGFVVNAYGQMNAAKHMVPILQELLTRTGGRTWQQKSLPTKALMGTITALSFSSPTTGWVALYSMRRNQTVIESTVDQGQFWRVLRLSGHPSIAGAVSVIDQINAETGCVAASNHLWCSVNGGQSWYSPNT